MPVRAVARVLELPFEDDSWIHSVHDEMRFLERFFNYTLVQDDSIVEQAVAASHRLREMLSPFVDSRSSGTGNDLISRMWREGPDVLDSWNVDDVHTNMRNMLFGGSETTTHVLANMFHMLLTEPGLMQKLRDDGDQAANNLVEEALRLYGAIQFRGRRANTDIEIGGVKIAKDETVIWVLGAVNRDPAHHANPNDIDLGRRNIHDHMAFNTGPRTCVDRALARLELQEAAKAFAARLPDMRLNPDAEPPRFAGFMLRDFRPLNILFTPGETQNAAPSAPGDTA